MAVIEAKELRALTGESLKLTSPTFPLQIEESTQNLLMASFIPPVNHFPDTPDRVHLIIVSNRGDIALERFEFLDNLSEKISHVTGGVVILTGAQPRLAVVAHERPLYDDWSHEFLRMVVDLALLKVNPNDRGILVKPTLDEHQGIPYVLQNVYDGRHGLMLLGNTLGITDINGTILVDRDPS